MRRRFEFRSVKSPLLAHALILVALLCVGVTGPVFSQAPPIWSGQAQCQLNMQGSDYVHQETQTWTITGASTSAPRTMPVFPGTWSVAGQGTTQRSVGPQSLAAQWTTKVPATSAPIAVFVRASDNRLIIKLWHSQLRLEGAISGARQVVSASVPPTQYPIELAAFEWPFPPIEDVATSTTVSGSSNVTIPGTLLPLQSPGNNGTANCTWQFRKGAASPAPLANNLSIKPIPTINEQLNAPSLANSLPVDKSGLNTANLGSGAPTSNKGGQSTGGGVAGGAPASATGISNNPGGGADAGGKFAGSNVPGSAGGAAPGVTSPGSPSNGAAGVGSSGSAASGAAAAGAASGSAAGAAVSANSSTGTSAAGGLVGSSVPSSTSTSLPSTAIPTSTLESRVPLVNTPLTNATITGSTQPVGTSTSVAPTSNGPAVKAAPDGVGGYDAVNSTPASFQISLQKVTYPPVPYGWDDQRTWCNSTGCKTLAIPGDTAQLAGQFQSTDQAHVIVGRYGADQSIPGPRNYDDDGNWYPGPFNGTVQLPGPTTPLTTTPAWIYVARGNQHSNLVPVTYAPPMQQVRLGPALHTLATTSTIAGFGADLHTSQFPSSSDGTDMFGNSMSPYTVEHIGGAFGGAKGDDVWFDATLNDGWYAVSLDMNCQSGTCTDNNGIGGGATLTTPFVPGSISPKFTVHWWVNGNSGVSTYTIRSLLLIGPQGTFPYRINGH